MRRRELLIAGLTLPLVALPGVGKPSPLRALAGDVPVQDPLAPSFTPDTVPGLARALAAQPFQPAAGKLPDSLRSIGYDQYREIRFDPRQALWRGQGRSFQAEFFHRAFLFGQRVDIHQVADGMATPIVYQPGMFSFGSAPATVETDLGFAGFRLHAPINTPDYFDEVCAFLGASYFRAVAQGQRYGLSARGLALRTGDPAGEEFPVFKAFWIERPEPGAGQIVVHALMDSPSVAGAFAFVIHPGQETVFDVSARLYPRVALSLAGIAPLTSMFQFDASDRVGIDDYRSAVHDSGGLALDTASGEQLWRPLCNPVALQESTFDDDSPRGFGLMQRKRRFSDYGDSEAQYERRPSLWVEPVGDWGRGSVHLFELPTADEYHDNIVAFWRPSQPLAAGREHRFDYRLHWCDRRGDQTALAKTERTRIGAAPKGARQVVIDLAGGGLASLNESALPRAEVHVSHGQVTNIVAHASPETGGWRLAFELHPGDEPLVELRARLLSQDGNPLSETWIYRWTRS
ncbi:glucan biosynthesis protein [Lysobacter sp. A289]